MRYESAAPSAQGRWLDAHQAEVVDLIRLCCHGLSGRIIDVGTGFGLWTRGLRRRLSSKAIGGLDP